MKIQILSDIHAEFHFDNGKTLVNEYLKDTNPDVVIVAGDVGVHTSIVLFLKELCSKFRKSQVLFVPGNHDFYNIGFDLMPMFADSFVKDLPNLSFMYNSNVVIGGIQFVGTTLWTAEHPTSAMHARRMADSIRIDGFPDSSYVENKKAVDFLNWHVNSKSIVITHHVPCPMSISETYKNDPLEVFFLHDMTQLIEERQPMLWVHGHTHDSFNYTLGKTHIICNPLGYIGRMVNPNFIPNLLIET
jgi:Icc-related predicted phosphoesterase